MQHELDMPAQPRHNSISLTPHPAPQVSVEEITPEMATYMLLSNFDNRKCSAAVINQYARDLLNGDFLFNGDAIRFDWNGALLDGQHRLYAIVQSGVTLRTVVVRGLPPESKSTIDTGKPRSLSDHLAWQGYQRVNVLAGAITLFSGWETGVFRSSHQKLSRAEADAILSREPGLVDAIPATDRAAREIGAPHSIVALAWYLMAKQDAAAAVAFFDQIATGANLKVNDPAYTLRRQFINAKMKAASGSSKKEKLSRKATLAYFIKGWNAYRAGRPLAHLKFADTESFPEVAA